MSKYLLPRTQHVVLKCVHMKLYRREQCCDFLALSIHFLTQKYLIPEPVSSALMWYGAIQVDFFKETQDPLSRVPGPGSCSPALFFRWQVWLQDVDVYRWGINQSRWAFCFPLGVFQETRHQWGEPSSKSWLQSGSPQPTKSAFYRGCVQSRVNYFIF